MIEKAYKEAEPRGFALWCHDQAGPFQTVPYLGTSWQPQGEPVRQPHEYIRNGTAKLMTLFHPASGQVRAKGVTSCPNNILQPWLKQELSAILAALPPPPLGMDPALIRKTWAEWYEGLAAPPPLPDDLPPLRLLLVQDNLAGHKSHNLVQWCFRQGIALLYTPLGGSWLNMAESIQGIIERRALNGQHPATPQQIIEWLEAAVRGWNKNPTPFVWGGKRAARRNRARKRRQDLAGSGAYIRRIRPRTPITKKLPKNDKDCVT
ncbi:MAG TPA: transposase [Anaerolineae bacterium]